MSHARRTAEALEAAHENTKAAANVAGYRSERGTLPQHIRDMQALVEAVWSIQRITGDLAAITKSCVDTVRVHYFHGDNPTGASWPEPLRDAAGDAGRALTRLRSHLHRTPTAASHDTLSVLLGFLRDVHRATSAPV